MPSLTLLASLDNVIRDIDIVSGPVSVAAGSKSKLEFLDSLRTFFAAFRAEIQSEKPTGETVAAQQSCTLTSLKTHLERALEEITHGKRKDARMSVLAALTSIMVAIDEAA